MIPGLTQGLMGVARGIDLSSEDKVAATQMLMDLIAREAEQVATVVPEGAPDITRGQLEELERSLSEASARPTYKTNVTTHDNGKEVIYDL